MPTYQSSSHYSDWSTQCQTFTKINNFYETKQRSRHCNVGTKNQNGSEENGHVLLALSKGNLFVCLFLFLFFQSLTNNSYSCNDKLLRLANQINIIYGV